MPRVADGPPAVEEKAQRIAAQAGRLTGGVHPVDVDSLRLVRPRSVGVGQVGLWALRQLGPAGAAEPGYDAAERTGHVPGRVGDARR